MNRERNAYLALRRAIVLPGDRFDRVENLSSAGFPDVNGCFRCREFWMELKAPVEPVRPSTPLFGSNHKLTIEQRNWFLRQSRAGGRGYVYIDTDSTLLLIDGCKHFDEVNDLPLKTLKKVSVWWCAKPITMSAWHTLRMGIIHGQV